MEQNKDQSSAAVRGEAVAESWKPNIVLIANACEKYEEGSAVGLPEHGMAQAFQYLLSKMPVSARAADALDSQPTEWNDAIEAAVGHLEQMGDSLGDHADHNNCEMTCCDSTRMHALSDAASAVLVLKRASSQPTDGGVRNA